MIIDCGKNNLIRILNMRLRMWGLIASGGGVEDNEILAETLSRTQMCFSHSRNKRYISQDGQVMYSITHSVQTCILLYYLSNTAFKYGNIALADSVYYLNKIMHAVDWFYEITLPVVFGAEHPVGSVLGRASYGNRLFVHQNTTIGSSLSKYPTIGNNVVLCSNSCVLGNCHIGNNVIISAGSVIVNTDIPDNSIAFRDGCVRAFPEREIIEKIAILTDFIE